MLQAARVVGAELCSDCELVLLFLVGGNCLGCLGFRAGMGWTLSSVAACVEAEPALCWVRLLPETALC